MLKQALACNSTEGFVYMLGHQKLSSMGQDLVKPTLACWYFSQCLVKSLPWGSPFKRLAHK